MPNHNKRLLPGKIDEPQAEIVPAVPEDHKAMVARMLDERIAELMASAESAELEPFFQSRAVVEAMRARQTIAERNKWRYYSDDYGCLICERTDVPHISLGMCRACLSRTRERLQACMRRRAPDGEHEVTFKDTARLAQEALLPSIEKLAHKRRNGQ
jgi:hypothetical protein